MKEEKEGRGQKAAKKCREVMSFDVETESPEVREKEKKNTERVKEVEGVVFVPYPPDSKLRNALQSQDEMLAAALQAPSLRFVERLGTTIVQDVGQSDPWTSASSAREEIAGIAREGSSC